MDRIVINIEISRATVCRILQRNGLNCLSGLALNPPPPHYQYENAGGLRHIEIKKRRRFDLVDHRVTGRRVGASGGAG